MSPRSLAPRRWTLSLVIALLLGAVSSGALAQGKGQGQGAALDLVGVEGVPERIHFMTALQTGDVLMVPPPSKQERGQPMLRMLVSNTIFQIDPVIFGDPNWARMRVDHAAEAPDRTLWAVTEEHLIYKAPGQIWAATELPELVDSLCGEWSRYGVPCQMVVPLGAGQAVVLRPVRAQGALSTQVLAIEQGTPRPLAELTLPGVALGPAVSDGEGGFWVMLRRTQRTSSYKPMRGYLHYTAAGEWLMWSDSGESVEGTSLRGRAKFLIDPDVRKMAPDGEGGFWALGRDRIIYRVGADGAGARFSDAQPTCQYCQPLSLTRDPITGELHYLMGEWREGEAGQFEPTGPVRWLRFGPDGVLLEDQPVPIPDTERARPRRFYEELMLVAGQANTWISGPDMLLHHDRQGWSLVTTPKKAQETELEQQHQSHQAEARPALATVAIFGTIGVGVGGTLGGVALAGGRSGREDASGAALYATLAGAAAGWLPGRLMYPAASAAGAGQPLRWGCVGGGALSMIALVGLGNVLFGELSAPEGAPTFTGRAFAGAFMGSTLGTAASMGLMRLYYDNVEDPNNINPYVPFLGSLAASGISTLFYFLLSPAWGPPGGR